LAGRHRLLGAGRGCYLVSIWLLPTPQKKQGAAEKIKRETDVHLRQLAKQSTHVPSFFNIYIFCVFLGVSRQGEFENTGGKCEYVSKKITEKIFFRGGFFPPFYCVDF
jgi:hypothetical protein